MYVCIALLSIVVIEIHRYIQIVIGIIGNLNQNNIFDIYLY